MTYLHSIWRRTKALPATYVALPVPVMLVLAFAWIVIEYVWLGKFSLFVAGDNISVLPYLTAFGAAGMPFSSWIPFPAAGTDMISTGYGTLVFEWAFSVLPAWAAFQVLTVAPILAGFLGVYGLCRRIFGLGTAASCFTGFAYGVLFFRELFFLSGVQGYLPLTILALGYLLDDKKTAKHWLGVISTGFLIAYSSFISRLVPWPIATYFLWFLIIERRRRPIDWLIIALFSIAIMAARWQDIVALLSYQPLSAITQFRAGGTLDMEMSRALSWLIPDLSLKGLFPLAFFIGLLVALRNGAGDRKLELLAAIMAIVGMLFLGVFIKVYLVDYLPFMKVYNFTYIMQGFNLLIVIAGGVAFNSFRETPSDGTVAAVFRKLPLAAVVLLLGLNLMAKTEHLKSWVSWGNFHQNSRNPVFQDIARQIRENRAPQRFMSFQMHGSLLNSYGLETLAGYHPLAFTRYITFWRKMTEGFHNRPEWRVSHSRAELGSITSILPSTIKGLGFERIDTRPQWRFADFVNLNLMSLVNGGYVASRDELIDQELKLISGPDRSWNSLSRNEKIITNLKANFTGKQHMFVYRNPGVFGRAFTVDQARIFETGKEVLDHMAAADREALSRTVFLEKEYLPPGFARDTALGQTGVAIRVYRGDRLELDITPSESPTIMVITNSFSPYWRARIDGVETAIIPADHAFWGVFIPAGATEVIFDYRPPYKF